MKNSVYLAGPFFNEAQIAKMDLVKDVLIGAGLKVLDPREIGPIIGNTPKEERTDEFYQSIFDGNVRAIFDADIVLACIDEKDSGTAFEIGVAYALDPTFVFTFSLTDGKANVMLARAGAMHLRSLTEIREWANAYVAGGIDPEDEDFKATRSQEIDE